MNTANINNDNYLSFEGVYSGYGSIEVLHDINFTVKKGEVVTLIGANGAGKTTLLMTLCGQPKAQQGKIQFDGHDLLKVPMYELTKLGIAHVPEGRHIFPHMTVYENLQMGAEYADKHFFNEDIKWVHDLFPILSDRASQRGGTLSGGEQQMLAIARGLMSRPALLLLDEPSLGLAPLIVERIFNVIRDVNLQYGITILLIEQNAFRALKLADRAFVLVNGRITLSGTGKELLSNPEVRAAYLEGGH